MELDLQTCLLSQPALAGLVGNRIHPRMSPQGTELPRITYRVVTNQPVHSQTGRSGLERYRVQIDCWAKTFSEMVKVAKAIKNAIDGTKGTWGATEFSGIFVENEIDIPERSEHGEGAETFHRAIEFLVWASSS